MMSESVGKSADCWEALGVSIDSRTLRPGDLFVAIEGPNFDGHAFAADAFDKGAVAAIVARKPENVADKDAPLLMLDDTLEALGRLGRAARERADARVIAVTGSVGKTGVKEALAHVLGSQGATHAAVGNLNNHWGLPLSLARMPRDADFGIFEMGMNHAGEISKLSKMARPHVAVVTAVEAAHSEFFESIDAIADAKAEIFEGVEPGGWAVIKRDMPYFHRLAKAAAACGVENVIGFGAHDDADARLVGSSGDAAGGSRVTAIIGGKRIDYLIPLPGSHWVMNSLGVLAAVHAAGGDVALAAAALGGLRGLEGRGLHHEVFVPGGAITVIDDSYNASPASMKAAFEVLAQSTTGDGGRRIAVLGEMLELGADSAAAHASLAEPLSDFSIDLVFTTGAEMANLAEAMPESRRGGHGADSKAIAPMVAAIVRPGDVVTVKGSAASRMGVVVAALLELGEGGEV